jgi:DNA-binding HxlR family transcriptional regulator
LHFVSTEEDTIGPGPPPKRHPYDQWAPDARALDIVGDKWTLLIIRDLSAGPRRFVELQRVLPGISTEQLRSRLNRMVADGLLTRQRFREVPPRVDYDLTERAHELMPVLGALARWGYDWAWSAPRPGERVDVGAVLRLAPGLVVPPSSLEGTVDLVIEGEDDDVPASHAFITFAEGIASISERTPATPPAARVSGPQAAWIAALGPEGSAAGLSLSGQRPLADAALGGIMRSAARAAAAA